MRPRTRITRLVEEVETFRKNGKELSIRNEEKAKLQVGWFAKEGGRGGAIWNYAPCPAPHLQGWSGLTSSWSTAWRAGLQGSEGTSPPPSQNLD